LDIAFIDHLYTPLGTSKTAPPLISTLHNLPKDSLSLFPAFCVLTSRSLATASNSGGSSPSRTQILVLVPPVPTDNCELSTIHSGTRLAPLDISARTTYKTIYWVTGALSEAKAVGA
jgi:hypothetical protein